MSFKARNGCETYRSGSFFVASKRTKKPPMRPIYGSRKIEKIFYKYQLGWYFAIYHKNIEGRKEVQNDEHD